MYSTTHAARQRGHLSRRALQLARAEAFSRRTPTSMPTIVPVKLGPQQRELIEQLVRGDRAAASSALLVVTGIGAAKPARQAVLAGMSDAAYRARAPRARSARDEARRPRGTRSSRERGRG